MSPPNHSCIVLVPHIRIIHHSSFFRHTQSFTFLNLICTS
uniref:Uncharacterized protein n=1 Tax=Arundo donax TaxID=35708 RepID=A0A0A9FVF2_ARUDO